MCFTHVTSFYLFNTHFIDEEKEAQKGSGIFSTSHRR